MDVNGVPIIDPGVRLDKVDPLPHRKLLIFLNAFTLQTASFMNRFAVTCETKLEHIALKIRRLEVTMELLEVKLASIPGLENVTSDQYVPPASISAAREHKVAAPENDAGISEQAPTLLETDNSVNDKASAAVDVIEVATAPPSDGPLVKSDPRYAKFFKMLQFGVPPRQIKMKMTSEGLDPDMLDTPDAPAPAYNEMDSDKDSCSDFND